MSNYQPIDPFNGMGDFDLCPDKLLVEANRRAQRAVDYEIALKVVGEQLRPVQKRPTAKQMAAQIEMARDEIDRVLMPMMEVG